MTGGWVLEIEDFFGEEGRGGLEGLYGGS